MTGSAAAAASTAPVSTRPATRNVLVIVILLCRTDFPGAIGTAGLALAASFALLALVPLGQFREIAAAMALGIVIDTFIVRSLLVPALVVLAGRAGRWPAREGTLPGPPPTIPHPGQRDSGRA